jgi:hypothetical protein
MSESDKVFAGSVPENYDRLSGKRFGIGLTHFESAWFAKDRKIGFAPRVLSTRSASELRLAAGLAGRSRLMRRLQVQFPATGREFGKCFMAHR